MLRVRQNQLTVIKDEESIKFSKSFSIHRLERENSIWGVEWVAFTIQFYNLWSFRRLLAIITRGIFMVTAIN